MYIDIDWAAKEYLRRWRCKAGSWKKDQDEDAVKCWNLERVLGAELFGKCPPMDELPLEELVKQMEEKDVLVENNIEEIVELSD